MIIKKISRIIACEAGIMSMLVCINTFSIPVCAAQNNIKSEFFYNQSLMNKELKNNVIEQDGNKITVDKICGSKNKIKVHLTFESNKSFKDYYLYNGSQINIRMEGCENEGAGDSFYLINDNKMEYEADIDSQNGFSETGIIRVDIVDGYRDINASLKIPVDFKEDFQKNYVKDLSGEIKDTRFSIKQFVSNNVQTGVVLSWPESDDYMEYVGKDNFLINIDDKIYLANETDNFMKDNDLMINTSRDLSYNQIEDAKKVTIINYYNSMTDEELDKYYENYDIKDSILGEISEGDNSGADFSVKFNDKTEGKIKVVKENDKVKLYFSSDSNKKSMLMALNTFAVYYDKSNDCYDYVENKIIYKDKNVDNQYIIELDNNIEKENTLSLLMEKTILEYDKFIIGDEITVK